MLPIPHAGQQFVSKHEVLTPSLAHDARIGFIEVYIVANGFPYVLKYSRRTGEVYPRELMMLEYHIRSIRA
jgi:hypothetical protein